jgi:very-short-patch-repair endonuclease
MPRLTRQSLSVSRKLRSSPTDAERLLWRHLRMRQMTEFKFRRQYPVGKYVVDFVCIKKRLAIEIDGGQHAERTTSDTQRTKSLEAEGYQILRFWNNDVLQNIEGVKAEIWRVLNTPPPPQPSP